MEGDGMAELRDAHPAWEISVNGETMSARWLGASPVVRFTRPTAGELADAITAAEKAGRVHPYSWRRVMAAVQEA